MLPQKLKSIVPRAIARPGAVLVTALFDLAGREHNPRRTIEEYLEFGATVLDLDENIVFYADPGPAAAIQAARSARGLDSRTVVHALAFEQLHTYRLLGRVEEAASLRPILNSNPEKDTPLYRLLTWSKFELLARTVDAPPFCAERAAWLDFGIGHVARNRSWTAEQPLRRLSERIRLLRLRPYDSRELADRDEYFSQIRGLVGGGLIGGGCEEVGWLCDRFFEELDDALEAGWAPLEEQLLPLIAEKEPAAFEFYDGDYADILDNYGRPEGIAAPCLSESPGETAAPQAEEPAPTPRRRTAWPTNPDLDLLHAALDENGAASAAWDRWRLKTGGIPDAAARRMLPLVEWNLRRGGGTPPRQTGFVERGVARSLALSDAAGPVLEALSGAGLRPVVLKGLALSHLVYPHPALRTMADIDILVRPEEFERAGRVLESLGWKPAFEPQARLRHLHGLSYARAGAPEIDLHFRALAESRMPDIDRGFLSRTQTIRIGKLPAETLCAADHLLCVCVHGVRWSDARAIHWVADAVMILRRTPAPFDWETLVAEARARRLEPTMALTLGLMSENFKAPIPKEVLGEVSRRPSRLRKWELAARMSRPSLFGGLLLHWRGFMQEQSDLPAWKRLWRFPAQLRELWALDRVRNVPSAAIRKIVNRLRNRT